MTKGSLRGITDDEVSKLVSDLERMVPRQSHQWIDWDQTRKEQGNWPINTMVSMWFQNETNLVTIIELLKVGEEELKKVSYNKHGLNVSARLEVCPQKKPLTKAYALFFKELKEVEGDESKIIVVYGKLQISFRVGGDVAAKYTREGEGLTEEGWVINFPVVSAICTEFSDVLFEAKGKSS